MNDLERYLKTEYVDADYRLYELRRGSWKPLLRRFWTLCLLMANSLY